MKYDDATWHSGGDFPSGSPTQYGGTHIGLFLRWCFTKQWAGELHTEEEPEDVERVKVGEKSGTDFLFQWCDGKLTDEDLTEEGNAFVSWYYGKGGEYLNDYARRFSDKMYLAPESEHDFQLFSAMVERRYVSFLSMNSGGAP